MAEGGIADVKGGTDETFDFLCSLCLRKDKNSEAKHLCLDCQDYYCTNCVKFHDNVPALKTHKIMEKEWFPPGSSPQFPAVPTERCRIHAHKTVDMYCKKHDVAACYICMVDQHSTCKEKFYVPDYIQNNSQDTITKETAVQLDSIDNSLAELVKAFINEKEKLINSKNNSLKQIQQFREEINQQLDKLEKGTIQELEQRVHSLTDKIEAGLKELQASKLEAENAQESFKAAGGNMTQMFVSIKIASEVASRAKKIVNTTQVHVTDVSFLANQKLQLKDVQVLGSINITQKLSTLPQVSQSKPSLLHVRGNNRYSVKVKSDSKTCNIYSACTLPDGSIILADRANSKLKQLDSSSYSVTGWCDVPQTPRQVCAITNNEVAVCCYKSQQIQFVSTGKTMQKNKTDNHRV